MLDAFWAEAVRPDAALAEDFVRAIADTIQIRGVYYAPVGRAAGVAAAAARLGREARLGLEARLAAFV